MCLLSGEGLCDHFVSLIFCNSIWGKWKIIILSWIIVFSVKILENETQNLCKYKNTILRSLDCEKSNLQHNTTSKKRIYKTN